jgi:hypothetical protein
LLKEKEEEGKEKEDLPAILLPLRFCHEVWRFTVLADGGKYSIGQNSHCSALNVNWT